MMTKIGVLGPLRVIGPDGDDITPRGALQRRLLASLVLHRDATSSIDALTEELWPDGAPGDEANALNSHVSRLRQRIPGVSIDYTRSGYTFGAAAVTLDIDEFERTVAEALAVPVDDPRRLESLSHAVTLWRGDPFADLDGIGDAVPERSRLTQLHLRAAEERLAALVATGRHDDALADLNALTEREPLRERPHELLMTALDRSGRRAEALRVYDAFRRALGDELGVEPSAALSARHNALLAGSAAETTAAPPSAVVGSASALPGRPASTFVGRADVVARLRSALSDDRVVTLVGPGGVGKTRLAIEVAHLVADDVADGVRFVDLTSAEPASAATALASVFGVEPRADVGLVDRLTSVLRRDRILLVVDNCEHVLDAVAPLIEGLVAGTDHLTVLATSRERLAVDAERLVRLEPLPAEAEGSAAVQLFADRATAASGNFVLDEATRTTVTELCRRLDGLPLAIELAATRLDTMTVGEVLDGLDSSSAILRGGRRSIPRHRSLEQALTWSFDLLDEPHRIALDGLAAFAAPTTPADVAAVIDGDPDETYGLLIDLVEQSLVRRDDGRFGLLETVRQFIRTNRHEQHEALGARHAAHLLAVAERLEKQSRTAVDDTPIRTVHRLTPDFRQALDRALDDAEVDLAVRLVEALRYPSIFSATPELLDWGAAAGAAAEHAGHPGAAGALACAAQGAWKIGDFERMASLLTRADRCAATLDVAPYLLGISHGTAALVRGDFEAARAANLAAAESGMRHGDLYDVAEGLASAAFCAAYAGSPHVHGDLERAIAALPADAGVLPQAWTWYCAGETILTTDPDEARRRLTRSVDDARTGGAVFVESIAGASLASLEVRHGTASAAEELYRRLLPMMLRGTRSPLWTALRTVAELLVRTDRDEPAARLIGAVDRPGAGHELVGDDRMRVDALIDELVERIGSERFQQLRRAGAQMDELTAVESVLTALDA